MGICSRIFLPDIRDFLFFKERTVLSMQDSYDRSFLMKKDGCKKFADRYRLPVA